MSPVCACCLQSRRKDLQLNFLCSHGCLWFSDYTICLSSLTLKFKQDLLAKECCRKCVSLIRIFFLLLYSYTCAPIMQNTQRLSQIWHGQHLIINDGGMWNFKVYSNIWWDSNSIPSLFLNAGHFCFYDSCLGHTLCECQCYCSMVSLLSCLILNSHF